jgi:hypothetical protein
LSDRLEPDDGETPVKAEKVQTKPQEKLTMEQKVRREIIAWFWVGLVFLLINGAIGQARVIPSASMEDTLLIGDHLIMSRVGYDAGIPFTGLHLPLWRNPKRQQIIIFNRSHAARLRKARHWITRRQHRHSRQCSMD